MPLTYELLHDRADSLRRHADQVRPEPGGLAALRIFVRDCLRLPDDCREIIKLRYYQNLPFDEIGRVLGRSANAACLLWLRTIQRLKLELKNQR